MANQVQQDENGPFDDTPEKPNRVNDLCNIAAEIFMREDGYKMLYKSDKDLDERLREIFKKGFMAHVNSMKERK